MSTIQHERRFLETHSFPIHPLDEIVKMASEILGPDDEFMAKGSLNGDLADVLGILESLDNCERALAVPSLTKELRERFYVRPNALTGTKWEQLDLIFGDDAQFHALALCFPKYWARGGVGDLVKKCLARLVLMRQRVVDRIE
jgi:hypothetical protein